MKPKCYRLNLENYVYNNISRYYRKHLKYNDDSPCSLYNHILKKYHNKINVNKGFYSKGMYVKYNLMLLLISIPETC